MGDLSRTVSESLGDYLQKWGIPAIPWPRINTATKAIFRENFLWMLFYITLNLCDPHYTLLYYQLYRDLVSLYQIIWTFTDPEKGGFWKTYLDKEKMLVTSSFACYYNVFYSTLTKFYFCHLQMLSIWTYKKFYDLVWRYEALK